MKSLGKGREQKRAEYWNRIREFGGQYPSFDWPSVELVLNLICTYSVFADIISKKLSKYGLSRAGFNVLMILVRSEEKACKQCDIGRLMFVSRANITGLVDGLVDQGFVERRRDIVDRRVWLAAITSQGEALLRKLLPEYYRKIRQLCSALSDHEKKQVNRFLCQWRFGLNELDNKKI